MEKTTSLFYRKMTETETEELAQDINEYIVKECSDVLEKYNVTSVTCINTGKYEVLSPSGNTYTVEFVSYNEENGYGTFECNCNTEIKNYKKCRHFEAVVVISGRVTDKFNIW
jgi:hypothetical protein